jgi:hypothetical protein
MTDLSIGRQLRWGVADTITMTRRNLSIWLKVPAFIAFTVIQPVMFTLLFRYVFGGSSRSGTPSASGSTAVRSPRSG